MILFALILWSVLFYFVLDKYVVIKTWLLKAVISFLFVSCITSFLFFYSLVVQLSFGAFQVILSVVPLLLLLYYFFFLHSKKRKIPLEKPHLPNWALVSIFLLIGVFTIFFFNSTQRWGHWDGWAIWTMHAKFLFYENSFVNLFTNEIDWTHPDYPLMQSSIIAILWKSFNNQSPIIPLVLAYTICILIMTLIVTSFIEKGQLKKGLLSLFILSCTGILSKYGGLQYADTLLSLFFLLPFVLITHHPKEGNPLIFLLVGFFVASGAWVKNEGLAFFVIFSFFYFIYNYKDKKALVNYLIGAAIPLITIIFFKVNYAPVNDLVAGTDEALSVKLFDLSRHYITLKYFIVYLATEAPIVLFLGLYCTFKYHFYKTLPFNTILSLLALYYLIYILTPRDLVWQLSNSFDRLVHQITAVLLYTMFIVFSPNWLSSNPKINE